MSAALVALLIACGGSGSTGLISAESALLAEVRETGECRDANGTTYCFAEFGPPDEMGAPMLPEPSPCLDSVCEPADSPVFAFDAGGIAPGSSCAVATRVNDGPWSLTPATSVEDGSASFEVPLPTSFSVDADSAEAALLCFDEAPADLPATLDTLADAGPTIILVSPTL